MAHFPDFLYKFFDGNNQTKNNQISALLDAGNDYITLVGGVVASGIGFSPERYGASAVYDGLVDDGPFVQDAIDAARTAVLATGGPCYVLLNRMYRLEALDATNDNSLLRPKSGVSIIGQGDSTGFVLADGLNTASDFMVIWEGSSTTLSNAQFCNFKIDGNGTNNAVPNAATRYNYAIGAKKAVDVVVDNVYVVDLPSRNHFVFSSGVDTSDCKRIAIRNCRSLNAGLASSGGTHQTDHSTIYLQARGFTVSGNVFENDTAPTVGAAFEVHGSSGVVHGNTARNYQVFANLGAQVDDSSHVVVSASVADGIDHFLKLYIDSGKTMDQVKVNGADILKTAHVGACFDLSGAVAGTLAAITIENFTAKSGGGTNANTDPCFLLGSDQEFVRIAHGDIRGFWGQAVLHDSSTASSLFELEVEDLTVIDGCQTATVGSKQGITVNPGGTPLRIDVANNKIINTSTQHCTHGVRIGGAWTHARLWDNAIHNVPNEVYWYDDGSTIGHGLIRHVGEWDPNSTHIPGLLGAYVVNTTTGTEWFGKGVATESGWRQLVHASSAPASGYHERGDEWRNTLPSSGGAPGGMCTATGTPGTWKNHANLA